MSLIIKTVSSHQKGGVEKRELELGERMSNEAVDINPEEYKRVADFSLMLI